MVPMVSEVASSNDTVKEMRVVEFDDYPFTLRTCQDYLKAVSEIPRLQFLQEDCSYTSFCPATRFCVELDLGAELCRMRGETFSPYLKLVLQEIRRSHRAPKLAAVFRGGCKDDCMSRSIGRHCS